MYANLSRAPLVIQAPLRAYSFAVGGYYAEDAELDAYFTSGQLRRVSANYPTDNPTTVEATRTVTNRPDDTEELAQTIIEDVEHLHHLNDHTRIRIYPRRTNVVLNVTSGVANGWGAWTEAIPADLIPFQYHIDFVMVEAANAATFFLQFCANRLTPSATEILGETRFVVAVAPRSDVVPNLVFECGIVLPNAMIGVRLMCSAPAETISYSLGLVSMPPFPHPGVHPLHLWPDWPW